jgi:GNAT superfamily N-acetyltransferase
MGVVVFDVGFHGRGIGALLLRDALTRVLTAAEQVAVRAVVAHAITDQPAAFYVRFGFRPLADEPRTLMITLEELRRSREPQ